ncbi:hypothetical protein [Pseudoduganella lutea]|uniref:Uncharacterized protein n=1 Tax=Pseudoduganella lutea TaxID=321985 RepID=A0A4P6L458_9BURK|nr:hypothetical protein [Pseudoduganella lutea]QBE66339.1 hypothetical protein EWM63_27980 [Pseudoduganella lutea]
MDAELAKTIAAYGGLGLGLVNLAHSMYKDYWRKARLEVFVGDARIRTEVDGSYDIEVPIQLRGKGGTVTLRSAEIRSKTYITPELKHSRPIGLVMDHPGRSLLDVPFQDFGAELGRRSEGGYEFSTLKLEDKDAKFVVVAERVIVPRGPDGYWEWSLGGWELVLHHSAGESAIPFEFKRHSTDKNPNRYTAN